jgi:two-component system sensor histidine kinase CpxA
MPWVVAGFGALLLSVLFWIPFVHGITRDLGRLTRATERIAEGQFEQETQLRRGDELGRLGSAIQQMARRLAGYVTGQKRFLGDIAHELCSPLARMEMALAILDQRASPPEREYVADVREEVRHMSALVNELLLFSKASLRGRETTLSSLSLKELVQETIVREATAAAQITCDIATDLRVMAESALLSRAIGNLIRNSLRYAGDRSAVTVTGARTGDGVVLTIFDNGPGVPPETLSRLGEPFFRPDSARTREAGGTGLGLAIVRTCVDACHGSIVFSNRIGGGLEARIVLQPGPPEA